MTLAAILPFLDMSVSMQPTPPRPPWYRILYVQVLIAVGLGILIGYFWPESGKSLKPLGDAFIKLVKMIIAPIIFCTVVHGIASMGNARAEKFRQPLEKLAASADPIVAEHALWALGQLN